MIFWTWAKALEDEFDGSNRRNLRHFISTEVQISEKPTRAASPSVRSGDDTNEEVALSDTNIGTLDYQFKEEVSLFLHRDTPTSLTQRITTTGITIEDKPKIQKEEKMALARLPTCAIFHKLSAGKGAPHTFYGFLRQWPSVPRIVVRISLCSLLRICLTVKPTRFSCPFAWCRSTVSPLKIVIVLQKSGVYLVWFYILFFGLHI